MHHGVDHCHELKSLTGVDEKWAKRVHEEIDSGDLDDMLSAAEKIARKLGAPSGGEYRRWLRETISELKAERRDVLEALRDLKVALATTNYDGLNQGIKLSLKNSLAPFLVTCLFFGTVFALGVKVIPFEDVGQPLFVKPGLVAKVIAGLITGVNIGLIVGLNRGGSTVIKHYALRLTLWFNGYRPFKFVEFLDHCARLTLLKKVGGGYIFIHRMLLDYFAELPPTPPKA